MPVARTVDHLYDVAADAVAHAGKLTRVHHAFTASYTPSAPQ